MAAPSSRSSATVSLPPAETSLLTCRDGAGDDTDAHDDDPATIHVVGLAGETICGTVRLYPLDADRWKGDRLAVLASDRHLGLGAPLVRFAVRSAGMRG